MGRKKNYRSVAISPQRLELMRGIHAGKFPLVKKGSGVCPVCGEQFDAPANGHGSKTCRGAICQTEYRTASTAVSKGYLDVHVSSTPQPHARASSKCDPWFVRYGDGYQRTADPGWGF